MDWETIKVQALLSMLPSQQSGWTSAVSSILRPNHNFNKHDPHQMCFGEITIPKNEKIYPGESKIVPITFILQAMDKNSIKVGFQWRIYAASQHFANGEIIAILPK